MAECWVTTHKQCSISVSIVQWRETVKALLPCCVPEGNFYLEYKPQGWSDNKHSRMVNTTRPRVCGRGFQDVCRCTAPVVCRPRESWT